MRRTASLLLLTAFVAGLAAATPASAAMCWEMESEDHVIYDGPYTHPVVVRMPTRFDTSKCIVFS